MTNVIDCDQHLYETRTVWGDHIEPSQRDEALAIVDGELGYPWLTWRGRGIELADVQIPGKPAALGRHRNRRREGLSPEYSYDEALPDDYWEPAARIGRLDAMGLDAAVLFPNFGLLWERALSGSLPALTANMGAWNRWCTIVAAEGGGRLHPVAHLTLRDPSWLEEQLRTLAAGGVRLAMIAAAPVAGRPLSHPDHDRVWSAFVEHGVTPVFHVGEQQRVRRRLVRRTARQLRVPARLGDAVDAAGAGRHRPHRQRQPRPPSRAAGRHHRAGSHVGAGLPDDARRGWEFTNRLNGRPPAAFDGRPSDYFRRQVRVAAFSYEQPERLAREAGDLFMLCSDYPHAEGTKHPVPDYTARGLDPSSSRPLFRDNASFLLGRPSTFT